MPFVTTAAILHAVHGPAEQVQIIKAVVGIDIVQVIDDGRFKCQRLAADKAICAAISCDDEIKESSSISGVHSAHVCSLRAGAVGC